MRLLDEGKDLLLMGMPAFLQALEDIESSDTVFEKAITPLQFNFAFHFSLV